MPRTWLFSLAALCLLAGAPALQAQQRQGAANAPFTVDPRLARRGKQLWGAHHCADCHTFGRGAMIGPDLADVAARRGPEWLRRWLKDTERMLQSDSTAIVLLVEYGGVRMPNHPLSDEDVDGLIHYLVQQGTKR